MTVEGELLMMMHDEIEVRQAINYTGTGYTVPSYGPPTVYRAHIEERRRFVRNDQGELEQVTHTIYVDGEVRLSAADQIKLLRDGQTPRVIGSEVWRDEYGDVHHTEILCGRSG